MRGPIAATGHMPFSGHRTVAEVWEREERYRHRYDRDPCTADRTKDAREGSARLREAILSCSCSVPVWNNGDLGDYPGR